MSDDWTTNDPSMYLPPKTTRNPNAVAMAFLGHLFYDEDNERVRELITPQSMESWGSFDAVRQYLRSLEAPAVSTGNTRPEGARDVAYVALVTGVSDGYVTSAGAQLPGDVITLVWHEEFDSWLVAGIGPHVPPEALHRPSTDTAPERA